MVAFSNADRTITLTPDDPFSGGETMRWLQALGVSRFPALFLLLVDFLYRFEPDRAP